MSKEKKKGFWSWLGFGKKAKESTPTEETIVETNEIEDTTAVTTKKENHIENKVSKSENVISEVIEEPQAEEVKPEVTEEPQAEEVKPEADEAPQEEEVKLEVVEETQAEDVKSDVTEEPQAEEVKADVTEESQAEEVKAEVTEEPQAEEVKSEVTEEPQTEEVKADVTEEPQTEEVKADVTEEPQAEEVKADVTEEPQTKEVTPEVPEEPKENIQDNVDEQILATEESMAVEDSIIGAEEPFIEEEVATELEHAIAQEESEAIDKKSTEETENIVEQEKPSRGGFFSRLVKGLIKTKQNFGSGFKNFFLGKKIDDDLFEELEEQLLIADVGVPTTTKIIDNLIDHADRKQLKDSELLYQQLKKELSDILTPVEQPLDIDGSGKKPYVILMVGVNGVGKTTTIGKLARQFQNEGKSVMLAAGDTFRAAAVEQLQVWGERNNIPVVAQKTGSDSASVIFDAMQSAKAKNIDVLIADTAGRLQNKDNLMNELKKIVRVMKKYDETAPHEIMLTLDAATGQNAISQAKLFNEAVGLTGINLTKLDGSAKGGVIFAIADQFNLPIRYIGVGEKIEDLRPFKADEFIDALFVQEEQH